MSKKTPQQELADAELELSQLLEGRGDCAMLKRAMVQATTKEHLASLFKDLEHNDNDETDGEE